MSTRGSRSPISVQSLKAIGVNLTLCLLSFVVAGAVAEIVLRIVRPTYEYAAKAWLEPHDRRLWARAPGAAIRDHPDTGEPHWVIHNSLGLREHRTISPASLSEGQVIAFFGDSYTENLRIPVQFSFTTVVDYVLNQTRDGPTLALNFGVDGYGPDQEYLYYLEADAAQAADTVVYVFCGNDLRNIYENGLFELRGSAIVARQVSDSPARHVAREFARRSYLLYLFLDAKERWAAMLADMQQAPTATWAGGGCSATRRSLVRTPCRRAH